MGNDYLLLMMGLPMSGKTNWVMNNINMSRVAVVSPDAIRLALHGQPYLQPAEPMVWAIAEIMARALFNAGHYGVVIDATNTTQKRRDFWINKFPDCDIRYQHIDTSKEVCLARAEECERDDLLPVILRMAENFEPLQGK